MLVGWQLPFFISKCVIHAASLCVRFKWLTYRHMIWHSINQALLWLGYPHERDIFPPFFPLHKFSINLDLHHRSSQPSPGSLFLHKQNVPPLSFPDDCDTLLAGLPKYSIVCWQLFQNSHILFYLQHALYLSTSLHSSIPLRMVPRIHIFQLKKSKTLNILT